MPDAVLLIGAPGAGKSSVLEALTALLEIERVAHGAIETEELARGWPWLEADACLAQLHAALELQRRAGRRLFLVVATVESTRELRALIETARAERVLVVCLRAPADMLAARLSAREPDGWPGKTALIARARELAGTVERLEGVDATIDTAGGDAEDVAVQIREHMRARGMLGVPKRPAIG